MSKRKSISFLVIYLLLLTLSLLAGLTILFSDYYGAYYYNLYTSDEIWFILNISNENCGWAISSAAIFLFICSFLSLVGLIAPRSINKYVALIGILLSLIVFIGILIGDMIALNVFSRWWGGYTCESWWGETGFYVALISYPLITSLFVLNYGIATRRSYNFFSPLIFFLLLTPLIIFGIIVIKADLHSTIPAWILVPVGITVGFFLPLGCMKALDSYYKKRG